MDRRKFLRNAALGSAGLAAGCQSLQSLSGALGGGASSEQPNILVILADDMGYADIGSFGAEIDTPNLDRLAGEGMRMSQFYNYPRCSPSRASLLTGLYPHQTGVGALATSRFEAPAYQGYLNDRCLTVAEALGAEGYHTSMVGKWHIGHQDPSRWPTGRGFDRFYGEHRYVDDYFKPTHQLYLDGREVEPEGEDWYSTDAYTDYMLQFLEESQEQEQPFFGYVAYNAPHFPLQAFKEDRAKYEGQYMKRWEEVRRGRYERLIEEGLIDERWSLSPPSLLSPETEQVRQWLEVDNDNARWWDLKMAAYAAQVDRMDQNIGRMLRWLDETGQAENTLVLFLSDNGGCAEDWINSQNKEGVEPGDRTCKLAYGPPWANVSNTPFRFYKQWTHEGGIATPFIARWPGRINPGSISHEVGHIMDVMPTCLDVAGVSYPDAREGTPLQPLEGKTLTPVLEGGSREGHDALFWEHVGNRAARRGDWKLVSRGRFTEDEWELYNMGEDRTETNDLSERYPDRARALAADYERWADRVGVIPWDELTGN